MQTTPIRTQRAFELISEHIRDRVRSGEFKVGDRLPNERELAQSLMVSRHAVREALRSLEAAGLVRLRKGATGGAFVSEHQSTAVADIMRGVPSGISLPQLTEARRWVEGLVVRVVCERATEADFAALEHNVALAEAATLEGRWPDKTALNVEFHEILARATHNPVLELVVGALLEIVRETSARLGSVMEGEVIVSRRRLLADLRAGKVDSAVAEMERHLRELEGFYLEAAARRPASGRGGAARHLAQRRGRGAGRKPKSTLQDA